MKPGLATAVWAFMLAAAELNVWLLFVSLLTGLFLYLIGLQKSTTILLVTKQDSGNISVVMQAYEGIQFTGTAISPLLRLQSSKASLSRSLQTLVCQLIVVVFLSTP